MISSFQFLNFKIDQCSLEMKKTLEVLVFRPDAGNEWSINLNIRQPEYFKGAKLYLGGLDCEFKLFRNAAEQSATGAEPLVKLVVGIAGVFQVTDRLDEKVETTLVRTQIPAILFPYLRAAATSIAASSGFGTVMVPLINVQKWAEEKMKDIAVAVRE